VKSQRVDVAIGVLVRDTSDGPCVLIARRPDGAVLGGLWELPGGKAGPNESLPECLRREFLEELGVEVSVGAPLDEIEHAYPHGRVRLHPFYCSLVAGEPENRAVAEHRWVRPSELRDYTFPPANAGLIETIARALSRPGGATSIEPA
jgi:mutator protein MutT